MSIASQLTALEGNISNAYDMVAQRGGTVPARKNMENLDDAIATIPSGGGGWQYDIHTKKEGTPVVFSRSYGDNPPTISTPFVPSDATVIDSGALIYAYRELPTDANVRTGINMNSVQTIRYAGLYYAFAPDQLPGGAYYIGSIKDIGFANLTTVETYGMADAFRNNPVETISFPSLTTVGQNAFREAFLANRCSSPGATVSFPVLTNVENYSFQHAFNNSSAVGAGIGSVDFSGLVHVDKSCTFQSAFRQSTLLQSADFSSLETVGQNASGKMGTSYAFDYAFQGCTALSSVDFSSLETIYCSGTTGNCFRNAFQGCTSLTSMDFSSLTSANAYSVFFYAFQGCTSLTSVDFSSLVDAAQNAFSYAFHGCTSLTTMTFDALETIGSRTFEYAFQGCSSLTTVSFPSLTVAGLGSSTNQFNNMLRSCSGVTVHFPSALQSTMSSWTDVTNGFGGTNTTVLFDL